MFANEYIANKKGERKESNDKKELKIARFFQFKFQICHYSARAR